MFYGNKNCFLLKKIIHLPQIQKKEIHSIYSITYNTKWKQPIHHKWLISTPGVTNQLNMSLHCDPVLKF